MIGDVPAQVRVAATESREDPRLVRLLALAAKLLFHALERWDDSFVQAHRESEKRRPLDLLRQGSRIPGRAAESFVVPVLFRPVADRSGQGGAPLSGLGGRTRSVLQMSLHEELLRGLFSVLRIDSTCIVFAVRLDRRTRRGRSDWLAADGTARLARHRAGGAEGCARIRGGLAAFTTGNREPEHAHGHRPEHHD